MAYPIKAIRRKLEVRRKIVRLAAAGSNLDRKMPVGGPRDSDCLRPPLPHHQGVVPHAGSVRKALTGGDGQLPVSTGDCHLVPSGDARFGCGRVARGLLRTFCCWVSDTRTFHPWMGRDRLLLPVSNAQRSESPRRHCVLT